MPTEPLFNGLTLDDFERRSRELSGAIGSAGVAVLDSRELLAEANTLAIAGVFLAGHHRVCLAQLELVRRRP